MHVSVPTATTPPTLIRRESGLREATVRLADTPIGVVVDQGHLKGVVVRAELERATERHRFAARRDPLLEEPSVAGCLRESTVFVTPDSPLASVIPLLQAHRLPALPVVDGPNVVAIVTMRNALEQLRELAGWNSSLSA